MHVGNLQIEEVLPFKLLTLRSYTSYRFFTYLSNLLILFYGKESKAVHLVVVTQKHNTGYAMGSCFFQEVCGGENKTRIKNQLAEFNKTISFK